MKTYEIAAIAKYNENNFIRFVAVDLLANGICYINAEDFGDDIRECERVRDLFTAAGAKDNGWGWYPSTGCFGFEIVAE